MHVMLSGTIPLAATSNSESATRVNLEDGCSFFFFPFPFKDKESQSFFDLGASSLTIDVAIFPQHTYGDNMFN